MVIFFSLVILQGFQCRAIEFHDVMTDEMERIGKEVVDA
jgi:hypothetical protein